MKTEYRNIQIFESNRDHLYTSGLKRFIEVEISLRSFGNERGELGLFHFLIDFIVDSSPKINLNETISYGLWLLKFIKVGEYFEIYELDEVFETWQEGADNAIYYIEQQKELCKSESTYFAVPLFTQKIAVSDGVLDGLRVQGIRYNEPVHMSGWYLTTSQYNGDVSTLEVIPLQKLVVNRKDLLQFLALPPGFVFEITEQNTCRIWKAPVDVGEN